MKFLPLGAAAALVFAGCSAGANLTPAGQTGPQSQTQAVQQSRPQATPSPTPTSTPSLTGRIVWTNGTIHVYNVATKVDASLGVTGVNPKFSPDGTLIVYQNGGIYVMNSNGTGIRQLSATGNVPTFDPTGTVVTYSDSGILTIPVTGGTPTRLTNVGIMPAYSPDGTQIAYNAPGAGSQGQQIFVMSASGGNVHQVPTSGPVIDTVWRPGKILFGLNIAGNYQLASYDTSTATLTQLTRNTSNNDEPSWSPDATHISWTNGGSGKSAGIWIMNADGTGQTGPVIAGGRQGSWGP